MRLKLPDAMRAGALNRPQVYGSFFDFDYRVMDRDIVGSCALGAVGEGAGLCTDTPDKVIRRDTLRWRFLPHVDLSTLLEAYPELGAKPISLPGCPCETFHTRDRDEAILMDVIIHLNDDHHMPREAIAAWLESLELAQQPIEPETSARAVLGQPVGVS